MEVDEIIERLEAGGRHTRVAAKSRRCAGEIIDCELLELDEDNDMVRVMYISPDYTGIELIDAEDIFEGVTLLDAEDTDGFESLDELNDERYR